MEERAQRRRVAVAIVGLAAAVGLTAWLSLTDPPREQVPIWLGVVATSAVALGVAAWAAWGLDRRRFLLVLFGGALALRVAALLAPVSLSDDIHRYLWDGELVADGQDPYGARPSELVNSTSERHTLDRLNSRDYYSVYPPLAQGVFAIAAAVAPPLEGTSALRVLFVALDLAAIWALLGLLTRLGRDRAWALVYAFHPLAYWEVAAGGHTEALMVPLLLLAVSAALDGRAMRAGALLGLATAAKLTALLAAPILVVHLMRRQGLRRAAGTGLVASATFAMTVLPFASSTLWPHVLESLRLYGEVFSFNAPVYYGLRDAMGYVEGVTPSVDASVMPLLLGATIAWLALMTGVQDGSRERLVLGLTFAFLGYLVFSRVIHPWYLLPVVALGVAARSPSAALIGLVAPLSYVRYHPLGREEPWVLALQFVPLAVMVLVEGAWRAGWLRRLLAAR